jgi:hypothetical protein
MFSIFHAVNLPRICKIIEFDITIKSIVPHDCQKVLNRYSNFIFSAFCECGLYSRDCHFFNRQSPSCRDFCSVSFLPVLLTVLLLLASKAHSQLRHNKEKLLRIYTCGKRGRTHAPRRPFRTVL